MIAAGIIVAHHQPANLPPLHQQVNELFRSQSRHLFGKGYAQNTLSAKRAEQLVALPNARKQLNAAAQHLQRMIGKRIDARGGV
ncbi:hypothetical protein SDC9_173022 [bioreactor metagenome]|uniref:Uncharacterized protein n=1 Tax=bioreactor metagenome TaxID=1076179 RepID=A0A645GHH8_9ZZZZ